jgi:hypothetical protein
LLTRIFEYFFDLVFDGAIGNYFHSGFEECEGRLKEHCDHFASESGNRIFVVFVDI